MSRYFADRAVAGVSVSGSATGMTREIPRDKDGFYVAQSKADEKALEQSGFARASSMGIVEAKGFDCQNCGFGSFFKTCSRCGTIND